MTNDNATAGPACVAAAVPANTKIPAPITHPTPHSVRFIALKCLFRPLLILSSCSSRSASVFLINKSLYINKLKCSSKEKQFTLIVIIAFCFISDIFWRKFRHFHSIVNYTSLLYTKKIFSYY